MIFYLDKQDYARLWQSLDSQVCVDEHNMSSSKKLPMLKGRKIPPQRREAFTSQQDITSQKIRSSELGLVFFLSEQESEALGGLPFSGSESCLYTVGSTAWMRELSFTNRTKRTENPRQIFMSCLEFESTVPVSERVIFPFQCTS